MPYVPPDNDPATEELEVAPSASDLDLGRLVVDASARPYVEQWFADMKDPGDTPARFLLRMVYRSALTHRANKLRAANRGPGPRNENGSAVATDNHADQEEHYRTYIDGEENRLFNAIEGILP